jgi:hypothetical protein
VEVLGLLRETPACATLATHLLLGTVPPKLEEVEVNVSLEPIKSTELVHRQLVIFELSLRGPPAPAYSVQLVKASCTCSMRLPHPRCLLPLAESAIDIHCCPTPHQRWHVLHGAKSMVHRRRHQSFPILARFGSHLHDVVETPIDL